MIKLTNNQERYGPDMTTSGLNDGEKILTRTVVRVWVFWVLSAFPFPVK